jgi:hypothetical protein
MWGLSAGSRKGGVEKSCGGDREVFRKPRHGEMVMGKEKVLENFEFIRQSFYAYL